MKGVPCKPIIAAFVSIIAADVTVEGIAEYLSRGGIKDVKCLKIAPKEGYTFKTATFYVSCDQESREQF